jgi:threonylcarbamoyladenosine tRNA methylthiotransferase MtaB
MKYAILTFGCRVNQADSFEFENSLRARGGVAVPAEEADLVIVNTCSVTGAADQGARNLIRRVGRDNARARIVVTGCYATRQPGDLAPLPHVVRLVPNDEKSQLGRWLRTADDLRGQDGWPREDLGMRVVPPPSGEGDDACGTYIEPGVMGRTAIPLRVQTGCEEECAFCIIPTTRGRSRSQTIDDVCQRARRLSEAGFKEVWLVGVHLGSYGRDLTPPVALIDLLHALDRVPGDVTFRISSLEPMDCSLGIVELVAGSGRFLPHVHLPLQHGSDPGLARMRRPYSFEQYAGLLHDIRSRLPSAAIGTDLLVGFPGEREEDAEEAAGRIEALPLTYLHVFPYSDRPGTEASGMAQKVNPRNVRRRAERLRSIGSRAAASFARAHVGRTRPGLTLEDGTLVLTDNFLKVRIPPGIPRNTRVHVRIDADEPALAGRVV